MQRSVRRRTGGWWLPLGVGFLMLLSGATVPSGASSGPPRGGGFGNRLAPFSGLVGSAGTGPINVTLAVNTSSVNLSNTFWGTTINNEVHMLRGETPAVNATPAKVLVWPGAMAGDTYDPFTDTHYNTGDGLPSHALTSETQFVTMCKAIHCTAIMQVPAEIDNASFAEKIVNYTEVNLSFKPAYWMIGNEPELWSNWKEPWKDWPYSYNGGPDPTQFGDEVLAYVAAIRNVDNTTPILGLPASGCTCGSYTFAQWIYGVLKVTGPKIQAVAFHEYPAGWLGTGDGSLKDFYGTLQSPANIPIRMASARAAVVSACGTCNVSVFISELGSALSWSAYGGYAAGFSGALSIASQITQAMDVNLTNVDLFATELNTTNSWFNDRGGVRPDYGLYTQIFDHLGSQSFSVNITGLDSTIYGIDTIAPSDHGRRDLLVVNDNITRSISFAPQFAESSGVAPAEEWGWNGSIHDTKNNNTIWVEPYTPNPVPQELPEGLPATYTLPPQSMVLFESYPAGATYVQVKEVGVPLPTPWYSSVGTQFHTTTASNLSLMLPAGSYPVGSVGIPLPLGGRELNPDEQLGPWAASPATVGGEHSTITVDFSPQWRVNASASPGGEGSVQPSVGWWNASTPLNLSASPNLGYAFLGWSGWGPGNASGANRTITITPTGRVTEKARFEVGLRVSLLETGLPDRTPWAVTVRGITTNSTDRLLTVYEANGTYGYQVSPVLGYRAQQKDGAFTVAGSGIIVYVRFIALTPPSPTYPVSFTVSGLPDSMPVLITVRNSTQITGMLPPTYELLNGSYAYHVGYVPGYHVGVPDKTFDVTGRSMVVNIPFVPTIYPVTWVGIGTRSGMNWSLEVNGTTYAATSAWVATPLPNGSYPYQISLAPNFTLSPRYGVLVVNGSAPTLSLYFALAEFPTWFEASGIDNSAPWSVRFGDLTERGAAYRASFMAANGTYTFDVHAPPGYYASPSHGTVTVSGTMTPTAISFHPTSEKPSAALIAALTSGALSVSFWIGVSAFVGFAYFRWLRHRGR